MVPFSASLLAAPGPRLFAVVVYGGNLVLITVAFFAHWSYATHNHRLVDPALDPRVIRDVKQRILSSGVLLVASIELSLWSPTISFVLYLVIQAAYIVKTTRTTTGIPEEVERHALDE